MIRPIPAEYPVLVEITKVASFNGNLDSESKHPGEACSKRECLDTVPRVLVRNSAKVRLHVRWESYWGFVACGLVHPVVSSGWTRRSWCLDVVGVEEFASWMMRVGFTRGCPEKLVWLATS